MAHYQASRIALLFCLAFSMPIDCMAQTVCSLRVPVPSLDYCDAGGMVEETISASVYRTLGNIEGVQEYQVETFHLFDKQLRNIITQSEATEMNIDGIQEEITDLAQLLSNIQLVQAFDESVSQSEHGRAKRAATPSQQQLQQLLDTAKLTFQSAVTDIMNKLQNLTQVINDKARQTMTTHATFRASLGRHQSDLTTAEQQLKTLDADVQKLATSGNTGVGGANISSVSQDVTDLLINASVAEQVHIRQLDGVDQLMQTLDAELARLPAEIQRVNSSLSTIETKIPNLEHDIDSTTGGMRIFESSVNRFLSNTAADVATVQASVTSQRQNVTQLGLTVLNATITAGQFSRDLVAGRKQVDGVQGAVTFANKAQQVQSGQILTMNKVVNDDLKLMKYAFGLLTSYP